VSYAVQNLGTAHTRDSVTVRTVQQHLRINLPIIQAPMAGVQDSALTVAVSNAGGLGSLPCAMLTPEKIRQELQMIIAQITQPYNVNFFCHTMPQSDRECEARWRKLLTPYYQELGLDIHTIPTLPGRLPFNNETADILEEFKPPVVSFHFGLPDKNLLARVKSWGSLVLSSATTLDEALWLEAHGADMIIAQGLEAGGHRGMFLTKDLTTQLGTFALVSQVVKAVKIPVIAAGGIVDARGVKAALALGAVAAQVGTAYLLCSEATTSVIHRKALKSKASQHTPLTNLFTGRPARGIMNRIMKELGPISKDVPEFPLATSALAPLRAKAESQGSGDFSPLWCGQNATGCKEISAGDLTRELASLVIP
jgi:nitronate monooxygenase